MWFNYGFSCFKGVVEVEVKVEVEVEIEVEFKVEVEIEIEVGAEVDVIEVSSPPRLLTSSSPNFRVSHPPLHFSTVPRLITSSSLLLHPSACTALTGRGFTSALSLVVEGAWLGRNPQWSCPKGGVADRQPRNFPRDFPSVTDAVPQSSALCPHARTRLRRLTDALAQIEALSLRVPPTSPQIGPFLRTSAPLFATEGERGGTSTRRPQRFFDVWCGTDLLSEGCTSPACCASFASEAAWRGP